METIKKSICVIIILTSISLTISAQEIGWRDIDQSGYKMKYKLPNYWEVDGFGWDNDWDGYGSSVCHCTGTINLYRTGLDIIIGMVVYPCPKTGIDSLKRQKVWNYNFYNGKNAGKIKTEHLTFTKKVGKWDAVKWSIEEMKDAEVWQLIAIDDDFAYIIYFWGDKEILKEKKKVIMKIIESFEPVRDE
ncbi:MAG: hypothetical protein K9J13_09110 [Saprospiraceae bacterium]|nr:hypothetical protein [Saprospiraceae bacterium]